MARIHHANVVAVHDVGMFDQRLYIAMEFVEGTHCGTTWPRLLATCAGSSTRSSRPVEDSPPRMRRRAP
ncbi:MAG: hypothetical protein U0168_16320 [Nannocystaceae bacterium]